jgi:hypothetical protein
MQTSTAPTSTARLSGFGDLRVVERSRGTAHPQSPGARTRVAPTSLLAPAGRRRPAARR